MRKREDVKDLLSEIDAVLHDNSWSAQRFQQKVLDLVHQPQQRVLPIQYMFNLHTTRESLDSYGEQVMQMNADEVALRPQADDVEPIFPEAANWLGGTLVRPDMSEDFPDDYYDDYFTPSQFVVVDGILYVCEQNKSPVAHFASEKEVPPWKTTQTNHSGWYVLLDQSGTMIDVPLDVSTVRCPMNEPLFPTSLTSRFVSVPGLTESSPTQTNLGEHSSIRLSGPNFL